MNSISLTQFASDILLITATLIVYQLFSAIQQRLSAIWFNPMLLAIAAIIPFMLAFDISFEYYFNATKPLNWLLEPAVVALGFPLYQHLSTIKNQWKTIVSLLNLAIIITICVSFILTIVFVAAPEIAVSLSLKSVTTPIGIALTEQLNGNSSITAFAIIIAGLSGALLGPGWLHFIGVHSAKAQGLAIGAASHALGTATVSKISYQHGAYGSLALIVSAVTTAVISPIIITQLSLLFLDM